MNFHFYQAAALRRARVPYVILEQASRPRLQGGGIGLWGPALKALRQLGVESTLDGRSLVCAGYRTSSQVDSGEWLVKPSKILDRHTSCLCLRRSELLSRLAVAADPTAVRYGARVESFEERPGLGVTVRLHGGETIRGATLIGCDGVHSTVRQQLFPAVTPRPCGYNYWQGVGGYSGTGAQPADCDPPPAFEAWHEGMRLGMVPLAGSDNFWFICADDNVAEGGAGGEQLRERLAVAAERFGKISQRMIHDTPANEIFQADLTEVPPMDSWTAGAVALMGDAVHAMAPNLAQGACLSIEDAMELAHQLHLAYNNKELRNETADLSMHITEAFREYEGRRQRRTRLVQVLVPWVHAMGSMRTGLAKYRNIVFNMFPDSVKTVVFDLTHKVLLGWSYTPPNLGQGLYHRLLGAAFMQRNPTLASFHASDVTRACSGRVVVQRGTTSLVKLICTVLNLPPDYDGHAGSVRVRIACDERDGSETWSRDFTAPCGKEVNFKTKQFIFNEDLIEQFGPLQFSFRNEISDHEFESVAHRTYLCLPGLPAFPLPKLLSPVVYGKTTTFTQSSEGNEQIYWNFDVELRGPQWCSSLCGLIVKYKGDITAIR